VKKDKQAEARRIQQLAMAMRRRALGATTDYSALLNATKNVQARSPAVVVDRQVVTPEAQTARQKAAAAPKPSEPFNFIANGGMDVLKSESAKKFLEVSKASNYQLNKLIDSIVPKAMVNIQLPAVIVAEYPGSDLCAKAYGEIAEQEINMDVLESTADIISADICFQRKLVDMFYIPTNEDTTAKIKENIKWIEEDISALLALKEMDSIEFDARGQYYRKSLKQATITLDLEKYKDLSSVFGKQSKEIEDELHKIDKQWAGFVLNLQMAQSDNKSKIKVVTYPWMLTRLFGSGGTWLGAVSYNLRKSIHTSDQDLELARSAGLYLNLFPSKLADSITNAIVNADGGADTMADTIWPQMLPYISALLPVNATPKEREGFLSKFARYAWKGLEIVTWPQVKFAEIVFAPLKAVTAKRYTIKESELPPLNGLFQSACFAEDILITLVQRYILLRQSQYEVKKSSVVAEGMKNYCRLQFGLLSYDQFVQHGSGKKAEIIPGAKYILDTACDALSSGMANEYKTSVHKLSVALSILSTIPKPTEKPMDASNTPSYKVITKYYECEKAKAAAEKKIAMYCTKLPKAIRDMVMLKANIEVSAHMAKNLSEVAIKKAKIEETLAQYVKDIAAYHKLQTELKLSLDAELAELMLDKAKAELDGDHKKAAEISAMISMIKGKRTNITLTRIQGQGEGATDGAIIGAQGKDTKNYIDNTEVLIGNSKKEGEVKITVTGDDGKPKEVVVEIKVSDDGAAKAAAAEKEAAEAKEKSDQAQLLTGDSLEEINDNMDQTGAGDIVPSQDDTAVEVEDDLPKTDKEKKGFGIPWLLLAGGAVAVAGAVPVGLGIAALGAWQVASSKKKEV
jgi:hypothetical protein